MSGGGTAFQRYTNAGGLDRSFSGDGRLRMRIPNGRVYVMLDPLGRLVVVNAHFHGIYGIDVQTWRYTGHGSPDRSFSGDGRATMSKMIPASDWATGPPVATSKRFHLPTYYNPETDGTYDRRTDAVMTIAAW